MVRRSCASAHHPWDHRPAGRGCTADARRAASDVMSWSETDRTRSARCSDDHPVDDRGEGRRRLRRRQRHQPLLRDPRDRAAARPAPWRARVGRDVRPGARAPCWGPPGDRAGSPGARPHGRCRPPDPPRDPWRRRRGAARPPRDRPSGPRGVLARRGRRAPAAIRHPEKVRKLVLISTYLRNDAIDPALRAQQGQLDGARPSS